MSDSAEMERRGRMWPWMVVGLLLLMVVMMGVLFYSAVGDPSHVVVENYYDKAIHWDEVQAQAELDRQLGWHVELEFRAVPPELAADPGTGKPNTLVVVQLVDSLNRPLDSLSIHLKAFFSARAGRVFEADLQPVAGGYGAAFRLGPPGVWEFQLEARRDTMHYTWLGTRELGSVH